MFLRYGINGEKNTLNFRFILYFIYIMFIKYNINILNIKFYMLTFIYCIAFNLFHLINTYFLYTLYSNCATNKM